MLFYILAPIRFFESRRAKPVNWALAVFPLILCAILRVAGGVASAGKLQSLIDRMLEDLQGAPSRAPSAQVFAVFSAFTYPLLFAIALFTLAALDICLNDSRQARRIAEFAGLAFFTQVPYCLLTIVAAYAWDPPPFAFGRVHSLIDGQHALRQYTSTMAESPLFLTSRIVWYYSVAWLAFMLAAGFRVATRNSPRASCAAALLLFIVFAGYPLSAALLGLVW